jgi:hypothetical protein
MSVETTLSHRLLSAGCPWLAGISCVDPDTGVRWRKLAIGWACEGGAGAGIGNSLERARACGPDIYEGATWGALLEAMPTHELCYYAEIEGWLCTPGGNGVGLARQGCTRGEAVTEAWLALHGG